jgi:N-hydroxyarylamine O-acetyltransferase
MNLDEYFHRIKQPCPAQASEQTIIDIHLAQLAQIPFENIDVFCGEGISLQTTDIWRKIVQNNRGGYCFELNTLLMMVLKNLGFNVEPLLARRLFERSTPGPLTHLLLKVTSPQNTTWLCDVGFGGMAFLQPLLFQTGREETQHGIGFKVILDSDRGYILQKKQNEDWVSLYCFSGQIASPEDLEMSNFFTSCHPLSNFKKKLMIVKTVPFEKHQLVNRNYNDKPLLTEDEFKHCLQNIFSLDIENEKVRKIFATCTL